MEVKDSTDNVIAQYEYNGLNQRIKKTVGGVLTKSFYNENWQEVESVTGSQMTSYVWGLRYIDDLVLREKGEERLYSLADPNWNVAALVDATGAVVERMKYDAFGEISWLNADFMAKTNSDYNWNRTFTGQVLDSDTGLMLYRNRYYHTGLGRFVSRDPIGYEAGDVNVYRYVANSIIFVDPDGKENELPVLGPNGELNCKSPYQKCLDDAKVKATSCSVGCGITCGFFELAAYAAACGVGTAATTGPLIPLTFPVCFGICTGATGAYGAYCISSCYWQWRKDEIACNK